MEEREEQCREKIVSEDYADFIWQTNVRRRTSGRFIRMCVCSASMIITQSFMRTGTSGLPIGSGCTNMGMSYFLLCIHHCRARVWKLRELLALRESAGSESAGTGRSAWLCGHGHRLPEPMLSGCRREKPDSDHLGSDRPERHPTGGDRLRERVYTGTDQ